MDHLQKKRSTKMIGIGAAILIPMVFLLSSFFAYLEMNNVLSVFLTVLITTASGYVYYLIFSSIADAREEKRKNFDDPFNH